MGTVTGLRFQSMGASELAKQISVGGCEYLVVPVVAVRQGVLNGELVLAEEFGAIPESWNGIPVPLGHPMDRGVAISANQPEIVASSPGRFYHARLDGDRLCGEIWIDIAKATALGGEAQAALQRMQAGEPTEVSTAYWRDLEETPGVYNDEPYYGIARNLRPDHLALLLHEIGACNWEMGCGCPRINKGGKMPKTIQVNIEMSLDDQLSAVYDAWNEAFNRPPEPAEAEPHWIREVFEDRVIAIMPEGLMAYPYSVDADGKVTFEAGERVEIVYQPVAQSENPWMGFLKQIFMRANAKKGGCPCMQEPEPETAAAPEQPAAGEQPAAEAQPETNAEADAPVEPEQPAQEPEPEPEAPVEPEQPVAGEQPAAEAQPETNAEDPQVNELRSLAEQFGGVEAMRSLLVQAGQARQALIGEILGNQRNTLSQNDLATMSTEVLQKLKETLRPADYSGRGAPRSQTAVGALVEAPMPKL